MMDRLREQSNSYRIQLGVLVALTEMLRQNKGLAPEISEKISDEQLTWIVNTVDNRDRTLRVYAAEFLYDLGDPRSIDAALGIVTDTKRSEQGRYLAVFVVKGAMHHIPEEEKQSTIRAVQSIINDVGPRTQKLIASLEH